MVAAEDNGFKLNLKQIPFTCCKFKITVGGGCIPCPNSVRAICALILAITHTDFRATQKRKTLWKCIFEALGGMKIQKCPPAPIQVAHAGDITNKHLTLPSYSLVLHTKENTY